jgi:small GTP-binding protein
MAVDMTTTVELLKKVCLLGDAGVGKTSLIRRFVLDVFDDSYITTIGAKVSKKSMTLYLPERDMQVNLALMIWDVSGQKEYKAIHEQYLKGMEGALVVADLSRQNTFTGLQAAVAMAERTGSEVPMIFLMNKCDLAEPSADDLKDVRRLASLHWSPAPGRGRTSSSRSASWAAGWWRTTWPGRRSWRARRNELPEGAQKAAVTVSSYIIEIGILPAGSWK